MHQVAKEEPISLLTLIEKSGKTLTTPSENALYLPGNSYIEETEDEKVVDLFNELTKDKTGKYTYCSLLGTQVVAGTNYLILSHYISEENVRSYKLLTIYNGVNGTKEIIREEEINVRYLLNNIIVAED